MKDIAIYRLQRVESALARLNTAVAHLETVAEAAMRAEPAMPGEEPNDADALQADLASLKHDYETLHAAATKVAARLDKTIEQLSAAPAGPG